MEPTINNQNAEQEISEILMQNLPNPNDAIIEQIQVEEKQEKEKPVDDLGREFSKDLHKHDALGEPILKKGKLQIKAGKKKDANILPNNAPQNEQLSGFECGVLATSLYFTGLQMIFGEDGKPIKTKTEDEEKSVAYALGAYLQTKNIKDIPAGWLLTTILVTSVSRRLMIEKHKQSFMDKVKIGWVKFSSFLSRKKSAVKKVETNESKNEVQ